MSQHSRGRATVSVPTDSIVIDVDNNNQGQEAESGGDHTQQQPRPIGVAPENYNIHESVFYTHGYYEKIKKEDGSMTAKCLMCWEIRHTIT